MSEFTPQTIKLQGKDYLEVAQRVLWLRTDHPDAQLITDVVTNDLTEGYALIKAIITIPSTGGIATGYGTALRSQLRGPVAAAYLEKAETRALGRAAAGLGYGTLAALDDSDAPADAPVPRSVQHPPPRHAPNPAPGQSADNAEWQDLDDQLARQWVRLGVAPDDTKTLILAWTGGQYRKTTEMAPDKLRALLTQVAAISGPDELNAWKARTAFKTLCTSYNVTPTLAQVKTLLAERKTTPDAATADDWQWAIDRVNEGWPGEAAA